MVTDNPAECNTKARDHTIYSVAQQIDNLILSV